MKNLKPFVKYGVLYGIFSIVLSILSIHVFEFGTIVQSILTFGSLFVFFFLTAKAYKSQNDGYLSFGEALIYLFLMSIIGFLISTVYSIIYFQYINPEYAEIMTQKMVNGFENTYRKMGMTEEKIAESLDRLENQTKNSFSFSGLLISFVFNTIFALIMSAIGALIFKKNKP